MSEVIVIDSPAYNNFMGKLNEIYETLSKQSDELKRLKSDYLMTPKEVMNYVGFGKDWLEAHRDEITWVKPGGEYRFLKSDLDRFLATYKGGKGVKNLHIKRS